MPHFDYFARIKPLNMSKLLPSGIRSIGCPDPASTGNVRSIPLSGAMPEMRTLCPVFSIVTISSLGFVSQADGLSEDEYL